MNKFFFMALWAFAIVVALSLIFNDKISIGLSSEDICDSQGEKGVISLEQCHPKP